MIAFSHSRTIGESVSEYGRGIAGGLMFSIPLFFTAEMWGIGIALHPARLVALAIATFLLLLIYNRYAGLRRSASLAEVAIDSVEEMGIGLVISAVMLLLLGRIGWESAPSEALGKIVVQALTTAIGVSVGTAQLGAPDEDEGIAGDSEEDPDAYLPQVAIAFCAGTLFAANVAPTDEVVRLANGSGRWELLAIAGFSLGICALVFHFSDFRGATRYVASGSWLLTVRGIVTSYAVALVSSAALLWAFGRFDDGPLPTILALTVVLALPTALGSSAGRLLLQSGGSGPSSSQE